ncbi:hypothetical protein GCM10009093_09250 [Brevundimonas terrae]|uniref:Uncharacterized protein n=1 Tax=Brevundimonas terrae TaxID=363631 RepID=A0ABP3HY69_9CAUL|nr:hypothetical protein [Brevundimonas terrae]NIJ25518.1 hypothetical protein [Brevundimonas terrae]
MTLNISWMWAARIAKVVALLLFFLPWVAVSCNGQPLIEASGYQLLTGSPEVADIPVPKEKLDAAWWAIAGAVVIVLGLIGSFVVKGAKTGGRVVLVSSVLAIALLGGGMGQMVGQMRGAIEKETGQKGEGGTEMEALERQLSQMMGQAIRVEIRNGFWLTLVFLAAAGACGVATQVPQRGRGPVSVDNTGGA